MRIAATDITDDVIGKRLIEYSHVGEDPRGEERRRSGDTLEVLGGIGYHPVIVRIRREDDDNHLAILLDEVLTQLARDENGRAFKDADGVNWAMVETDPPQGRHEIGFDTNGWIEVED